MEISVMLGAVAVVGALLTLWWALSGARHATATLDLGRVDPAGHDLRAATLQHGIGPRALQPLLERLGRWARKYTPHGRVGALEQRLLLAGTPRGWTTERVLAAKILLGGAGAVLGVLQLTGSPSLMMVVVAAGLTLFGFFGPDLVLNHKAEERQQVIRRSLADTVDQMVISVRAGLGLDAAIARVARTTEGPLASELARVVQDTRAGVPAPRRSRRCPTGSGCPSCARWSAPSPRPRSSACPSPRRCRSKRPSCASSGASTPRSKR